ncbi:MAG: CPBP family intramembrane glutamic endopeptidase [Phycisphaerales bacterium]
MARSSAASSSARSKQQHVDRTRNGRREHQSTAGNGPEPDFDESYWEVSQRPFQVLVFLLPLVIFYELAMLSVLRLGDRTLTNQAHRTLLRFFDAFGIETSGWYLPGLALIAVLVAWQLLLRAPWRIDWRAFGLMWVESLALAIPLLVAAQLIKRIGLTEQIPLAMSLSLASDALSSLDFAGKIAISVGAGLYEELVFRMLVLGVVHALITDVAGASHRMGMTIAIIVSSILFMIYHWYGADPSSITLSLNAFYLTAGIYFGCMFAVRGFGIVVAAHALYDIITALALM